MPDDLRIRLRSSLRFHRLCRAVCAAYCACLCLSAFSMDYRPLMPAVGLAIFYRSLKKLDPQGFTLLCSSLRAESVEWWCCAPGYDKPLVCDLHRHSKSTSCLWLECHYGDTVRSLLIFPDAVSYEHWRLLRRQLRLQLPAESHR